MKGVRGIIFDCDGVLFESRRANLAYYNAVLAQFDQPPVEDSDRERSHLCHTAASPEVFRQLLGPKRAVEALELAARLDYRQFIPLMEPEPGMQQALCRLAEIMPLAVATNRGVSMPAILEHFQLRQYFKVVVTSHDVPRPKPEPDMLHEASRRLEIDLSALLFVGDSELDQAAADAAGVAFAVYRGELEAVLQLGHHAELVELFAGRAHRAV
jgi:HAD superfamily hydrolase (TIGR01509 family)